jgi:hypothetical protein
MCWEGKDWTASLVTDCVFRAAACAAQKGDAVAAEHLYHIFLALREKRTPGIYSRNDAVVRLEKLARKKRLENLPARKSALSAEELTQQVNRHLKELVGG